MDDMIDPSTGIKITPSYHGKDCLGNGEHPGYECCCDNCEHFLNCYPEENVRFEESLKLLRVRDDIVTQEEMEREFNLPPLSEVDTTGVEFDDLEQGLLSIDVVNARRFARAVRDALRGLELDARCYGLLKEDYYLATKSYLERMEARLMADPEVEKHET